MTSKGIGRAAWRVGLSVLAAIGVAVLSHPLWLAPAASRYLSAASGRDVRFGSLWIGADGALRPVLHFGDVRIANAAWADPAWPLAELREAVMVLSWRSVVENRRIIEKLVLRDGRVDLERQADGLRNWRLRDPENRGPGRYRVLALEAEHCTLRFVHGGVDLDIEASSRSSSGEPRNRVGDALPVQLAFTGRWRGQAFTADVATVPTLTFYDTGRAFPLRGRLRAGDLALDLDGRAGDLFRDPLLDADVRLAGRTLAAVRAVANGGAPPKGLGSRDWRVEANAHADAAGASLDRLRVTVGASDASGRVALVHGDRDRVRAELASGTVDVADLRWLVASFEGMAAAREAREAATTRAGATVSSASGGASTAASASEPSHRRPRDLDVAFDARRLHWDRVPQLGRASVQALSGTGRPVEARFDVAVAGGSVAGRVAWRREAEPPGGDAELTVRGVQLASLLPPQPEKKRVTGTVAGRAKLAVMGGAGGAGDWLDRLGGSVDLSLADGSIGSLLDAEVGLQGFRALRAWIGDASAVPVRCARVGLDLKGGNGRFRALVLDTERTTVRGTGGVDLGAKTVDLTLTADAKERGVFALDRSIRLHGPLAKVERELVPRVEPPAMRCAG